MIYSTEAGLIIWMALGHWFADFVFQSHWMASNKSKRWDALSLHIVVYTIILTCFAAPILFLQTKHIILFFIITFAAHFITDAITSRITSRLWAKGNIHNFFVVIGLDQLFHVAQIWLTIVWVQL